MHPCSNAHVRIESHCVRLSLRTRRLMRHACAWQALYPANVMTEPCCQGPSHVFQTVHVLNYVCLGKEVRNGMVIPSQPSTLGVTYTTLHSQAPVAHFGATYHLFKHRSNATHSGVISSTHQGIHGRHTVVAKHNTDNTSQQHEHRPVL